MTAEEKAAAVKRRYERMQADAAQLEQDRETAQRLLATPAGEALLRYLERVWEQRGLGSTPEKTAYRVAFRDALEQLKDIREEGKHVA